MKKSPEKFIGQSPVGGKLLEVFNHNLAAGALRLVKINNELPKLQKLGNNEVKVRTVLESGYFGITNQNPEFIEAEISQLLIKPEDIPESYYELQQQIALEQGYGYHEITAEGKEKTAIILREDQLKSLTEWSEYLRSDENGHVYPDWFKVYVWESLKKLGEFDKEKDKFKKRTKSTTAPWPELNAEALAYVYDAIDNDVIRGNNTSDDHLLQLLRSGNFATLYAHALSHAETGVITPEVYETTEGLWIRYRQTQRYTNDNTAHRLSQSLRGKNTGWCTAGADTAAHQLSSGDFHVYYTKDKANRYTVPRIAIRMEYGRVVEVRGIEPGQEMEDCMLDVVTEKLKTLPGGDKYFEIVENMKRLTDIYNRIKADGELTVEDMIFLQFSDIRGFGWYEDPRVGEILGSLDRSPVDILKNKISYDELFRLTMESELSIYGSRIAESLEVIIDEINQLNDNNRRFLVEKINNYDIPLFYYKYKDLVGHSGALFVAGVSVRRILRRMIEVIRREERHDDIEMLKLRFQPIKEELVAAGANPDFIDGVLAITELEEDAEQYGWPYYIDRVVELLEALPYGDDIKTTIIGEFPSLKISEYHPYYLYCHIKPMIKVGFNKDDIARSILENLPAYELSKRDREYFESLGVSVNILDAYREKF